VTLDLAILTLHVLGAIVWIGGVFYQAHVLLPAARAGHLALFAEAAGRARLVTWTAVAVVVLTGFWNLTRLGPLERVIDSGAGLLLAGKLALVVLAVSLAAQRDFAQVTILRSAVASGGDPAGALRAIARLDRIVLALALVIVWLGLAVSRA
jgi:uncharacterized membrane protein